MRSIPVDKILQKITDLNPHWENEAIDIIESLPRRKYFELFYPFATSKEVQRAVILMGPRRVGKTVLLWQTIQELIKRGHPAKHIVYLPMDTHLFYHCSLDDILEYYRLIIKDIELAGKVILFDEIQYQRGWDMQLKSLVDQFPHTKFIASGSAAGVLNQESKESGAGRFTDFMLPPLTFYEYLELLGLTTELVELDHDAKKAIRAKDIDRLNKEFINYMNYGGFPEAVFNKAIRDNPARFIREDIIDKVLLKDLPSIYGIRDVRELNNFFHYLSYQTGNEISFDSLTKSSGIDKITIEKYLKYLEAAFLIRIVKRVDETGKTFKKRNFLKIYLMNPSMYTAIWGLLSEDDTDTLGHIVETALFSQWMHDSRWLDHIYYARFNQGRGEVDMVYLSPTFKVSWCLEVKWSNRYVEDVKQLRSLRTFCENNKLEMATITTKSRCKEEKISGKLTFVFKEAAMVCFNLGYNVLLRQTEI